MVPIPIFEINDLRSMKQMKFDKGDKKQVSFYYSRKEYQRFVEKFPNLTTMFLSNCLNLALTKRGFANSVIFNDFTYLEDNK